MSLFKKKDRTLYRHIGMALVPPVAFSAVPNSPPPTPNYPKKRKVIVSPIVPSFLGATATARAVALGTADREELKRLRLKYEYVTGEKLNGIDIEEDEVIAKLVPKKEEKPKHVSYEAGSSGLSRSKPVSKENLKYSSPPAEKQSGIVHKSDESMLSGKNPIGPGRKSNESLPNAESSQEVLASAAHLEEADHSRPVYTHLEEHDGAPLDDQSRTDLEERMLLKDEQTREMIMDLMQDVASAGKLKKPRPSVDSRADYSYTNHEKELIEEIANMLKGQSMSGAEGVVLKQQIQDIVDESQILKKTVERLNIELSRYQEKYGVSPDLDGSKGFIPNAERAKWLTNVKFLSPLFLSYDRQLELKDDVIANHEEQFMDLTRQMEIVLQENEVLRKATEQTRADPFISQQKWDNLKEQNELMLEEIQLQLQQLEVMEEKTKKMHVSHVEEVSRLAKRLALTDAESKATETARMKLKEELSLLRDEHDRLLVESAAKVPPDEHARAVSRLRHELEDVKEQNLKEMKEAMFKLKEMQKEKCNAVMKITELTSDNKEFQGEVEALEENRNELLKKLDCLQSDLDEAEERELECQLHLANTVRVAEQATNERATYAAVAEKEQIACEMARRRTMREQWEMGRMEEALKRCKVELASHNKETSDRIRDVEDCHTGQLMQYERKMSHLKKLLEQKQQAFDDLANNKKQMEFELETVWQAASTENRMMMDTLSRSDIFHR